jgi:micrococcal nuclease
MSGWQSTNVRIVATRPNCKERAERSCPDPPTITISTSWSTATATSASSRRRSSTHWHSAPTGRVPPFSRLSSSSGTSTPAGSAGCRRILQSSSSYPAVGREAIRLWGIDAPETGQDFGNRAEQAASRLAFGQTVTIRPRDIDRYGRTVAEVILPDGRSMNREMVRQGMAWWFRRPAPADLELERLEAGARAARAGPWSQPRPVPPWEWRRGQGVPQTAEVIGNRRSHVYHKPICRAAAVMSERNRIAFPSAADAEKAGYSEGARLLVGPSATDAARAHDGVAQPPPAGPGAAGHRSGTPPGNTSPILVQCDPVMTRAAKIPKSKAATRLQRHRNVLPKWRNGRRAGLKIRSPQGGVGSSPTFGTNDLRNISRPPYHEPGNKSPWAPPRSPSGSARNEPGSGRG